MLVNSGKTAQKVSTGVQSGDPHDESDHTASEGMKRPDIMVEVTNKQQLAQGKRSAQSKLSSLEKRKRQSETPKHNAAVQYNRSPNPLTFGIVAGNTAEDFILQGR